MHLLVLLASDQFWLNGGGLASAVDAEVATKTQRFVFKTPVQKPFASRLTLFFKRWNPGLVKNVPALQNRYSGKEHMLLKSLEKVYGVADLNRKPSQLQYNLIQFYMKHDKKNLHNVPKIIKIYKGKEQELKKKLETHYKGSVLKIPSSGGNSSGSALKSMLTKAKNNTKPTNLHYSDPRKILERDNSKRKCCNSEWKTCKACKLGMSVSQFCKNNIGKYGCMKSDEAVQEEKQKHDQKQKEEQTKHLDAMEQQVKQSKRRIEKEKEEKSKRAQHYEKQMKNRREEASKEQKAWVAEEEKRKKAAEQKEKKEEAKEKKVEEADSKRREAEFKSFRKHVEAKKEQMKKEADAKKKAEQAKKDSRPGRCKVENSAGGGTFSFIETRQPLVSD